MKTYSGSFTTREGDEITVTFEVPFIGDFNYDLIFSSDPVTIRNNSDDGLFTPMKPMSATVRVMTKDILESLFAPNSQHVKCKIMNGSKYLFQGYVTPCVYSQGFTTPYEELEIECVSPLSTLQYKDYTAIGEQKGIVKWKDVLYKVISADGIHTEFYIQQTLKIGDDTDWINNTYVDEQNFFDDDGEPWTCEDVLTEFCKVFGFSLVEDYDSVYFIDYEGINNGDSVDLNIYDNTQSAPTATVTAKYESGKFLYTLTETSFLNDDQSVSLDDLYGKINLNINTYKRDTEILSFDDDNLVCLHPKIPFIVFELKDKDYYDDNKTHIDYYRFYMFKDCIHYLYPSKFNLANETYGFDEATTLSDTTINYLASLDGQADFKNYFVNNILRNNLCCFVVKHFSYADTQDEKPNTYQWNTYLMVSYGVNAVIGTSKADYNYSYSNTLKNHYGDASFLEILQTKDDKILIPSTSFNSFLMCNGSIYFTRYPLNFDVTMYGTDDLQEYNETLYPQFTFEPTMFNYAIPNKWGGTDEVYSTSGKDGIEYRKDFDSTQDNPWYEERKDFLYNWHDIYEDTRKFNENVIDLSGSLYKIDSDIVSGKHHLRCPIPRCSENNVAPSFAFIKDMSIKVVRSYPVSIAITGKEPEDDTLYTYPTDYIDNDEYDIELKINTQGDTPLSLSSIMIKTDVNYDYASDTTFTSIITEKTAQIEEFLIDKYYAHYQSPKIIFECTLKSNRFTPISKIHSNYLDKDFMVDEMEYDVINDSVYTKLIEF